MGMSMTRIFRLNLSKMIIRIKKIRIIREKDQNKKEDNKKK